MAVEVTMPKLGLTMSEGLLARWLVADGKQVEKGQPIFEIETDKALTEADAPADGVLRITVEAGAVISVMGVVGYVLSPGEEMPGTKPIVHLPADEEAAPSDERPSREESAPARRLISPAARRRARELEIDIESVEGSGEGGRITLADVEAFTPVDTLEGEFIPFSGVRAVIAERMLASSQGTASVTLTSTVDATELVKLRDQLNKELADQLGHRIAYNDMLIKILARALKEFPYMNAHQEGDGVRLIPDVHIGLAVDTERGLMVVVLRNADRKSIPEISRETRDKAQQALAGTITPDGLSGGTFTLTNLGAFGVEAFTPIINRPEVAVLGVGRIEETPMAYEGKIALRQRMALSLTFDHRAVDGAPAARFLARVRELINKPDVWHEVGE